MRALDSSITGNLLSGPLSVFLPFGFWVKICAFCIFYTESSGVLKRFLEQELRISYATRDPEVQIYLKQSCAVMET